MIPDVLILTGYFLSLGLIGAAIHAYALAAPTALRNLEAPSAPPPRSGTPAWTRPGLLVAGPAVFVLITGLALHQIAVPGADTTVGVSLTGIQIEIAPSASETLPYTGAVLGLAFTLGAVVLRRSVYFPFFAFHAVASAICLLVDLIATAPVEDPERILEHALTASAVLLMISHALVGSLVPARLRTFGASVFGAVISAASFCVAAIVLTRLGVGPIETSFLFTIYAIVAFGILLPHVFALSLLVQASR